MLASFGIKPLRHLPSVGQNLSDHPVVGNIWFVNSTDTYETAGRNATLAAEQLTLWENTRTGPLVGNTFSQMGWFRLPSNATIFKQFPDPASGPHTAHFEFIIIVCHSPLYSESDPTTYFRFIEWSLPWPSTSDGQFRLHRYCFGGTPIA